jgi:hypothetical protein
VADGGDDEDGPDTDTGSSALLHPALPKTSSYFALSSVSRDSGDEADGPDGDRFVQLVAPVAGSGRTGAAAGAAGIALSGGGIGEGSSGGAYIDCDEQDSAAVADRAMVGSEADTGSAAAGPKSQTYPQLLAGSSAAALRSMRQAQEQQQRLVDYRRMLPKLNSRGLPKWENLARQLHLSVHVVKLAVKARLGSLVNLEEGQEEEEEDEEEDEVGFQGGEGEGDDEGADEEGSRRVDGGRKGRPEYSDKSDRDDPECKLAPDESDGDGGGGGGRGGADSHSHSHSSSDHRLGRLPSLRGIH